MYRDFVLRRRAEWQTVRLADTAIVKSEYFACPDDDDLETMEKIIAKQKGGLRNYLENSIHESGMSSIASFIVKMHHSNLEVDLGEVTVNVGSRFFVDKEDLMAV